MTAFRQLLIIKRREWIPLMLAVVVNMVGMYVVMGTIGSEGLNRNPERVSRWIFLTNVISGLLGTIGVGSWLSRLNAWIREGQ
jgi:hypothetical protein